MAFMQAVMRLCSRTLEFLVCKNLWLKGESWGFGTRSHDITELGRLPMLWWWCYRAMPKIDCRQARITPPCALQHDFAAENGGACSS